MNDESRRGRALTVVVPTRDRPDSLVRCLGALRRQGTELELVVVDDGSDSAAAAAIERAVVDAGGEVVRGAGAGPAAARNAGAVAAASGVILFLDDDCEPEPGWARALAAACPPGGSAAGATVNADPADRFAAASQLLTSELQRASLRPDETLAFAPTSNLAIDRRLALRLPFDETFPVAAGEDREWCARAVAAGVAPRYAPEAVVRHRQALGGFRGFWRQQVRYGRGAAILSAGRAGSLAGPAVRRRLLRAGLSAGVRVGSLVALAQLAVASGYALERLRRATLRA